VRGLAGIRALRVLSVPSLVFRSGLLRAWLLVLGCRVLLVLVMLLLLLHASSWFLMVCVIA
jgi:hypothetical protein